MAIFEKIEECSCNLPWKLHLLESRNLLLESDSTVKCIQELFPPWKYLFKAWRCGFCQAQPVCPVAIYNIPRKDWVSSCISSGIQILMNPYIKLSCLIFVCVLSCKENHGSIFNCLPSQNAVRLKAYYLIYHPWRVQD